MKTLHLVALFATVLAVTLAVSACQGEPTPTSEVSYPEAISQSQLAIAKSNGIAFYGKKWQISDDMRGALLKCDNIPDTRHQVTCNGAQPDFGGAFIITEVLCKYDVKEECIVKQ